MQAVRILSDGEMPSGIYTLDQIAQEKTLSRWIESKRAQGAKIPLKYEDVQKIVGATFLEGSKTIPTIWNTQ